MRRLIMAVLLATTPLLSGFPLSVHLDVQQGALVAKDTLFPISVQLLARCGVGMGFGLRPAVRIDLGAGLTYVRPSAIVAGVQYRGFISREITALLSFISPETGIGVSAGGSVSFGTYDETTALFFYPSATVAPVFALALGDRLALEWSIPISYTFRQDVALALSVGFASSLRVDVRAY
jgi:hypothetical protein